MDRLGDGFALYVTEGCSADTEVERVALRNPTVALAEDRSVDGDTEIDALCAFVVVTDAFWDCELVDPIDRLSLGVAECTSDTDPEDRNKLCDADAVSVGTFGGVI